MKAYASDALVIVALTLFMSSFALWAMFLTGG